MGLVPLRIKIDSIHAGMTTVIAQSHARYVMVDVNGIEANSGLSGEGWVMVLRWISLSI